MRWWPLAILASLAAACGDQLVVPDAPPPPPPTAGLVSLTFRSVVGKLEDQAVYFHDARGGLVLATRTAADGTASALMEPGGYASVVEERGGTFAIYTIADVRPGEPLFVNTRPGDDVASMRSFDVRFPRDVPSTTYVLWTACGASSLDPFADVQGVTVFGCPPTSPLLLTADDPPTHYQYLADATLSGTVELPGPSAPLVPASLQLRGLPAGVERVFASRQLLADRSGMLGFAASGTLDLVDGAGAVTFDSPLALPPGGRVLTSVVPFVDGEVLDTRVLAWGPATADLELDLAPLALRPVLGPPRFDPATATLRWDEGAIGRVPDGTFASLAFSAEPDGLVGWYVTAPRTGASLIRLPPVPEADLPSRTLLEARVQTFAGSGSAGPLRTVVMEGFLDPAWAVLGDEGTLVIE